jgi:hypothetical protein
MQTSDVGIDLCRCREIVAQIANGKEPNWRAMSTREGAMMQDYLRTLWDRHRQLLGDHEVVRCAANEASRSMDDDARAKWQEKYSDVM